ncbi:hypothetical protein Btru_030866 [Bulinus truncatus]|nr:hypothetical protein Btru_030866 [Bulinus truncatus]
MLPVVPNFYDALSRVSSPTAKTSAVMSSVTRGIDQLDSLSWTSDLTTSTRDVDNHVVHRIYVPSSTCRSYRGDLIRSMHILREHEPANRNYNTYDDRLELLKSVNVVPKHSGAGYDVHSSSHYTYTAGNVGSRTHLTLPSTGTLENIYFARAPPHRQQLVLSSGAKYSKNIGNPEMRKRLQEKLTVSSNKVNLMKSASSADVAANSMSSFDVTSTVMESYQTHISSASIRPSSPLRDASFITSERAQNSMDEVDSPFSFGISSSIRNTILPDSTQPLKSNYQESMYTDTPRKDPVDGDDAGSTVNHETRKRPGTPKLEHEIILTSPGFMSRLKNKTVRVKNNVNGKATTTKSPFDRSKNRISTRSSESNNSVSSHVCNCRVYHTHKFTGDACNHDVEARKEERAKIILATLRQSSDHRKDGVDDPRYVFWIPALSFHPYRHGDAPVSFSFLWPRYRELRELLQQQGRPLQQTARLATLAKQQGWPLQQIVGLASSANNRVGLFSKQQGWLLQQTARLATSANSNVGHFSKQ